MKINWKLRLQNKTTLLALIGAIVALVYQVLGILEIVPAVTVRMRIFWRRWASGILTCFWWL